MATKTALAEISADEFHALEEKVYRTIDLLKAAREDRASAEREAVGLRRELALRDQELASLRSELNRLHRDRDEVRTRVEKILGQIDLLTHEESAIQ